MTTEKVETPARQSLTVAKYPEPFQTESERGIATPSCVSASYAMDPNRTATHRGEVESCSPARTQHHLTSNGDIADLRIDFEPDQLGFFPSGSLKSEHYANQHESDIDFDDDLNPT
ncbi:hypothetical protein Bbelb_231740 [Branchiostoma belcheri]|nr:hypothetical protein Bbelb_231740 [Branchiostoma belcheri]